MDRLYNLAISYPDFKLNQIIDPEQFDLNNKQIVDKINIVIRCINELTQDGTGASNVSITQLPQFPSATDVQTALNQIASSIGNNDTLVNQINTRLTTNETKDVEQDGRLTTAETGIANRYTKQQVDQRMSEHQNMGHDDKYYRKSEVYTKDEMANYIKGGDTSIMYEVYVIKGENSETRTFTYADKSGTTYTGQIGNSGEYIFTLRNGFYNKSLNRIEATINDTLTRSVASGGLIEIDETHVALANPEAVNTEITFKYYQRIDLQGQFNIAVGETTPVSNTNTLWFKILT